MCEVVLDVYKSVTLYLRVSLNNHACCVQRHTVTAKRNRFLNPTEVCDTTGKEWPVFVQFIAFHSFKCAYHSQGDHRQSPLPSPPPPSPIHSWWILLMPPATAAAFVASYPRGPTKGATTSSHSINPHKQSLYRSSSDICAQAFHTLIDNPPHQLQYFR